MYISTVKVCHSLQEPSERVWSDGQMAERPREAEAQLRITSIFSTLKRLMASSFLFFSDCHRMPAAGIIPECSIVCYFGSLSENISQIASGKAGPSGKVTYILVGVTVFFMLAAVTWSTFVVRYDHA